MLLKLRWLLIPISIVYGLITIIRNLLFDLEIYKQKKKSIKLIGVGNLSMGGTGKSIVVDYLIEQLNNKEKIGVLSRGYKRISQGYVLAKSNDTPQTIGDEPFQFYSKYPNISVAVSECRSIGITELEKLHIQIVILDDVFQHRWVKPNILILTTSFQSPYFKDFIFPVGNLRELAIGANRADIILVTKCPNTLTIKTKTLFIKKINPKPHQKVYFTKLSYPNKVYDHQKKPYSLETFKHQKIKLITGIVDPHLLIEYLRHLELQIEPLLFPDHHSYTKSDFSQFSMENQSILTTEKDFYKLIQVINPNKIFYLPTRLEFFSSKDASDFLNQVST